MYFLQQRTFFGFLYRPGMIQDIAEALAPVLLLSVVVVDWSLISLCLFIVYLLLQYDFTRRDWTPQRSRLLWILVIILVTVTIFVELAFYVLRSVRNEEWTIAWAWFEKVFGIYRLNPWTRNYSICIITSLQLSLVIAAVIVVRANDRHNRSQTCLVRGKTSGCRDFLKIIAPLFQLITGVSKPSWIAFPFFLCNCFTLLKWSLKDHVFYSSWSRKPLLLFAASTLLLLYAYQIPSDIPEVIVKAAESAGLFKVSTDMGWPEAIFGASLLLYFVTTCNVLRSDGVESESLVFSRNHLTDRDDFIPSLSRTDLREHLLSSQSSHTNSMGEFSFQHAAINFFIYGVPISFLILAIWSFSFPSLCALVLVICIEYAICTLLSLSSFQQMNLFLLIFILGWSLCTYTYNAISRPSQNEKQKDSDLWEMVGFYHQSITGLIIFTQFCLAVMMSLNIHVSNYIHGIANNSGQSSFEGEHSDEGDTNHIVLVLALIAWCIQKSSRSIALLLTFILGLKSGLVHTLYMGFFLVYLLKSKVGTWMRRSLMFISAVHFAALYLLNLELISSTISHNAGKIMQTVVQLGLSSHASTWEFLSIALLLCFSAIQDHGLQMLSLLDSILSSSPVLPFGLGCIRSRFHKAMVSAIRPSNDVMQTHSEEVFQESLITKHISSIGQKFQATYHSCGAYIAFFTILCTVYLVDPNYLTFGYLFFLLLWIIGRQLVERTRRRLWLPLMVYTVVSFAVIYIVCSFPIIWVQFQWKDSLYSYLGLDSEASIFENIWHSAAVLVVMQLFRYEREQIFGDSVSKVNDSNSSKHGFIEFLKRLVIWHSGKILSVTVFYASISPVSVFGFVYLLSVIILSNFPKGSYLPAKLYATFTGFLLACEYLFQILGSQMHMFPGQKYGALSSWLGFQVFNKGFWAIESGLRSKVLVIVACAIQYNAFRWLELLPEHIVTRDKCGELCPLFSSKQNGDQKDIPKEKVPSLPSTFGSQFTFSDRTVSKSIVGSLECVPSDYASSSLFDSFWGSSKESQRWNRQILMILKSERYEAQLHSLKLYARFWAENFFNLYGLEINMIMLLLASFIVLNATSLIYILALCLCILLNRRTLQTWWPVYVLLFSCILVIEYLALANAFAPWVHEDTQKVRCHDCWNSSGSLYSYCAKCWIGIVVDDRQMLVSYFLVFILASFQLRANLSGGYTESDSYRELHLQKADRLVWKEISFETKGHWTWLDRLRLLFFRHLLDIVLMLVLITGTLEYDILHLGYLAFAMISFRARDNILKKQINIFRYLRLYNLLLIVLSLVFQAPFFGDIKNGRCSIPDSLYGILGLYKYEYGFKITSRSALIDIIIFCLVGLQSHIFQTKTFDQVIKYLEAEKIDAILHAQEKRAAWKTRQLQHIREIEDRKQKRRMQVEKMKAEMSHVQSLFKTHLAESVKDSSDEAKITHAHPIETFQKDHWRERLPQGSKSHTCSASDEENKNVEGSRGKHQKDTANVDISEITEEVISRMPKTTESSSCDETVKGKEKESPFASAVQFLGDGVAHVQSFGNHAVLNIVNFLNIDKSEIDSTETSSTEEKEHEIMDDAHGNKKPNLQDVDDKDSMKIDREHAVSTGKWQWLIKLSCYCWSKVCSNNDTICYCCFVFVFLWNFSLLSMVYLVALFSYALLVKPAPIFFFWISMLIYSEIIILVQYIYQIFVNHCGPTINSQLQQRIGLCSTNGNSSFVVTVLPLFIVYLFTLLQCSVKARDSEWVPVNEFAFNRKIHPQGKGHGAMSWKEKLGSLSGSVLDCLRLFGRALQRYWQSLTHGSEAPPHFVQVSMLVSDWPEDGIQPERIESSINRLLDAYHKKHCKQQSSNHSVSKLRVESIETSSDDSKIALAVFEVIYASSLNACPTSSHYMTLKPAADVASELQSARECGLPDVIGFPFPILTIIAGGKREIDLYAYIFCADLIAFFLVAIFYQSMIKHNNQFLDVYQLEDQFPKEFVFALMILFFLIVVDRVIYLWSFALGKVIYYFSSLVLFTYSVTLYAWNMEAKSNNKYKGALALRAFYLTKAISLALEALQIKFGLPHKSALYGQFLTSRVTNANYLGFRIYRALPFLYELRCVLDWSCTATSLTMYDWLKLEDIHASLYLVKCDIRLSRAKHRLGEKQGKTTKFWSGICLFLVLICVIWAPMLIYSSGNPTNIENPVKYVMTQLDVQTQGGRLTLYQNSVCQSFMWDDLLEAGYNLDPQDYLKTYDSKDIQLICCQADADEYWLVPSSAIKSFINTFGESIDVTFSWEFTRDRPKGKEAVKYDSLEPIPSYGLQNLLNNTSNAIKILNVYPKYLRLTGSGEAHELEQTDNIGANGSLILNRDSFSWWSFFDDNPSEGCGNLRGPSAIVYSEETPQGFIGETLSKFSIWSLYITFVLAVGRFIRLQCSDLRMRIPYENFPACDRLIAICEDIYAARAEGELILEELLFLTLVEIYRSPHVLIEYTKED